MSAARPPTISVLTPTLNSARTLAECLGAVRAQRYPQDLVEIIVADAFSADDTRAIAQRFGAKIVDNPLLTGEAGKAAALRAASGEFVALIDSDNILVGDDWLSRMTAPFADPRVLGAEPLSFVALPTDTVIDRYCAVAGVNDPLCIFIGVYDRQSAITGTWTGVPIETRDEGDHFTFELGSPRLPTIGANGTVYRRETLAPLVGDYLMDIDIPGQMGLRHPGARFAKVKSGIRHLFCADCAAFTRKQTRRVRDFFDGRKRAAERTYPWRSVGYAGVARFVASCVTVTPLVVQAIRGYLRSRDPAAFFHPVACWITLVIYGYNVVFCRGKAMDRAGWRQ